MGKMLVNKEKKLFDLVIKIRFNWLWVFEWFKFYTMTWGMTFLKSDILLENNCQQTWCF
jgi:hypothetical protein